jgi:hypothetical protein
VYGHQGRTEEALETFRRAGSEADAQYNMAFVLASKNDIEGAKARFHMALRADSSYAPARKALRSFEKSESDPELLAAVDDDEFESDGRRMVPFVEDAGAADAQPNSNAAAKSSSSTGAKTHALQVQAREMMQERLANRDK